MRRFAHGFVAEPVILVMRRNDEYNRRNQEPILAGMIELFQD